MATVRDLLKGPRMAAPDLVPKGRKVPMDADKVVTGEVEWVWAPYIPRHMVTMMTGDPSAGKGWVTADIASALSSGRPLPGQEARPPSRALFLCAEDNPEYVLVPRLKKQGADLTRVKYWDTVFNITSTTGMEELRGMILDKQPLIIFIDPITSFMGDQDPNKPTVVNALLSNLATLARETKTAIVAVRHRRKPADGDRKGRDPKFGGLGSIGFQGGARSELMVGMTEEGERAMSHEKTNVGMEGVTQRFLLDPEDGHLTWEGPDEDLSGWDLVGKMKKKKKGPGRPVKEMEEACAYLRSALGGGRRIAAEVYAEAVAAGLSKKTVSQAKGTLGVRAWNEGGVWWLEMPHA